ncbi:MAG: hypothetical protein J6A22_08000 [Bacteroidales bacterium]|nr:hypothetical protein [Bacteroidales bacterium]
MEGILVLLIPICICVVLPVMIVWLVTRAKTKRTEKKMDVLVKAIENGVEVDPAMFVEMTEGNPKSVKMELLNKLGIGVMLSLMGLVFIVLAACNVQAFPAWGYYAGIPLLAVGIGNLVSYFYGVRFMRPEIETDEAS